MKMIVFKTVIYVENVKLSKLSSLKIMAKILNYCHQNYNEKFMIKIFSSKVWLIWWKSQIMKIILIEIIMVKIQIVVTKTMINIGNSKSWNYQIYNGEQSAKVQKLNKKVPFTANLIQLWRSERLSEPRQRRIEGGTSGTVLVKEDRFAI